MSYLAILSFALALLALEFGTGLATNSVELLSLLTSGMLLLLSLALGTASFCSKTSEGD